MYSVESVFPSIQTEMENLRAIEKNRQILSLFLKLKSNGKQIFCIAYAVFFRYRFTLYCNIAEIFLTMKFSIRKDMCLVHHVVQFWY